MTETEMEEWAGALSQRVDEIHEQVQRVSVGLAKLLLGLTGQMVTIDIEKDLGVRLPRPSGLIVPATKQ